MSQAIQYSYFSSRYLLLLGTRLTNNRIRSTSPPGFVLNPIVQCQLVLFLFQKSLDGRYLSK